MVVSLDGLSSGLMTYIESLGNVQGYNFGMLIAILSHIGMAMVWVGIYGFWRSLGEAAPRTVAMTADA